VPRGYLTAWVKHSKNEDHDLLLYSIEVKNTLILTWRPSYTYMDRWSLLLLGAFAKLWKTIICFVVSVRPAAWKTPASTGRIFMKIYICVFFENLSRKLNLYWNLTWITVNLREDQSAFMTVFHSIIIMTRNVLDNIWRENQNTFYVKYLFFFENLSIFEIMWKNMEQRQYDTRALHAT
jgi:hypothetical protein